jgi:hypothetical protein
MTTLARISNARSQLKPFLDAVHAKGSHVLELSTGRRTNTTAYGDMVLDAVAEQSGDNRASLPDEARKRGAVGIRGARISAASRRTPEVIARAIWRDPSLTVRQKLAHDDMRGWSMPTAYRHLETTRAPMGRPRTVAEVVRQRYVYFVKNGRKKLVKIGSAYDIEKRMSSLQISSPNPLTLLGFIEADETAERDLHRRFKKQRVRGEWFRIQGDLAEFIAKLPTIREPKI